MLRGTEASMQDKGRSETHSKASSTPDSQMASMKGNADMRSIWRGGGGRDSVKKRRRIKSRMVDDAEVLDMRGSTSFGVSMRGVAASGYTAVGRSYRPCPTHILTGDSVEYWVQVRIPAKTLHRLQQRRDTSECSHAPLRRDDAVWEDFTSVRL